ncbi:MAG: type VI secretion system membrane subunit TssM [Desulfarculales bacterium]|jgi:type VI secretion system protein ImpL|nr:type VI secretion system membrane subunit TssM [Desulfarculales bacterium]
MLIKFFKSLWHILKMPWMIALLVTIVLILLVWLAGPLIAIADNVILESVAARLIATIILILCWGLFVLLGYVVKRQRELSSPDKAAAQQKRAAERKRVKEEVNTIRSRIKAAIKIVTTSNFYGTSSRSRYALPWYMLMGNPNSGKTSLLLNSGLQFPLNEQADRHLYQLKTTGQPEWLYSNHAIFIDLPGTYLDCRPHTFLHSVWLKLAQGLFQVRPARPLNGILLCVSIRDIMDTDAARREHMARAVRERLSEVFKKLRSHIPVYLIFSKCDAIPGFAQFFAHLSRAEKEQIFGCPGKNEVMESGQMRIEIKDLMQTLNAQIISKIHQERDIHARGAMFEFPQELAALAPRLEDFIVEAFGSSRYHKPVLFRGFFFSSSLSSHDVVAAAARDSKLKFQMGFQASLGDYAKGFFLLRLFNDFIIPEAKLAEADKEKIWAIRFSRYGMQFIACALLLAVALSLGFSFINNYARVEHIDQIYSSYQQQEKDLSITDIKSLLPELDILEQATQVYIPENDSFFSYGLGLYQGRTFNKATNAAYLHMLNQRFLPLIRSMAAAKVSQSITDLKELKNSLKAYIMLYQPEHINQKFIDAWIEQQWSSRYTGQGQIQSTLKHHWDYLLASGIVPADPDQNLLDKSRRALLQIPLADLAYQHMRDEAAEAAAPSFTFRSALGDYLSPFTGDTFPIPFLYTRAGYEEYLIKRCPDIIRNLTGETWIFGNNPLILSELDVDKIYKGVRNVYFRDYTRYWGQAVQALNVRAPASLADADKLAEQMTTGLSPVVLILRELRSNTTLIIEQKVIDVEDPAQAALLNRAARNVDRVAGAGATQNLAGNLQNRLNNANLEAQRDALIVRQYFVPLDSLLDAEGNPGELLKSANENMAAAGSYFARLYGSDNREQRIFSALLEIADDKNDTLRRLEQSAERLPSPVRGWYSTVSAGGLREMLGAATAYINRAYNERVLAVYNKNLSPFYPFNVSSSKDVNLEDFSNFFRVGGTLDSFYDLYLQPFVARNGSLRTVMGRTLAISKPIIDQLQRANRVQDAFFISGRELGINFLMEPYALDASLKQVKFSNGDKTLNYWHGPVQGASFIWPDSTLTSLETIDLNGINTRMVSRGDWSLFRVLQNGVIKRQQSNTCLIEVQQNGKWAQFLIEFRNKVNPFDPSVCSFTLPESLI